MDEQIRAHLETLEAAPGDVAAFRALEGLYERGGRAEELLALCEARARLLPPAEAAPLWLKAADLARLSLGQPGRAEALYRALLAVVPGHAGALSALATLAEERQDWPGLAEVLDQAGQAATRPGEAAFLALRLGRLFEEKLGRRDRAALQYARAVRLDPGRAEARERALEASLALRRYGHAKRLLDAAREAGAEPRALAAAYARLGALLSEEALFHDVAMDSLVEVLQRMSTNAYQAAQAASPEGDAGSGDGASSGSAGAGDETVEGEFKEV